MNKNLILILMGLLMLAGGVSSCEGGPVVLDEEIESNEGLVAIKFSAKQQKKNKTKALVNEGSNADFITLEKSCTETSAGGGGKAIGFWTDMEYTDANGNTQHRYNVFNDGTTPMRLIYRAPSWYTGEPKYWAMGSKYSFVAYYPQGEVRISDYAYHSNSFLVEYNTHQEQNDLMIAYNEVCTVDPVQEIAGTVTPSVYQKSDGSFSTLTTGAAADGTAKYGLSQMYDLGTAVPLFFKHMLAAVRVRFAFDHDERGELLECYFENDLRTGLHTTGTLVYGPNSVPDGNRPPATASEIEVKSFEHDAKNKFAWSTQQVSHGGQYFYRWSVKDGNSGVPFSYDSNTNKEQLAVAYSNNRYVVNRAIGGGTETRDSDKSALSLTSESELFSDNNGWLLVLPQSSPGTLKLHYRLKGSSSDRTATVVIPSYTGTDEYGNKVGDDKVDWKGDFVTDGSGNRIKVTSADCHYYAPGCMYTYTVTIEKTIAYVTVSIKKWEEYISSTSIVF